MANPIYEGFIDLEHTNRVFYGPNHSCRYHFHKRLELTYVLTTSKEVRVGDMTFTAEKDDIVYIPQYYAHSFSSSDACFDINYIPAHEALGDFESFVKNNEFAYLLNDKEYNRKKLADMFKNLVDATKDDKHYNLEMKGITNIIFARMSQRYAARAKAKNSNIDLSMQILNYIDTHYTENISLETMADELNYSKYYISRIFNKLTENNFKTFLNAVRTQHLVNIYKKDRTLNITDLAHRCGFDSLTTFYRNFNSQFNMNPKEYFKSDSKYP